MRSPAQWTPDTFGPAAGRVVAPLHASSAHDGAGPRRGAPDLAVAVANHNLLTNIGPGIAARDCVRDIKPGHASVGMRRSAHKAQGVFDEPVKG
jgi:hypothetical protein